MENAKYHSARYCSRLELRQVSCLELKVDFTI